MPRLFERFVAKWLSQNLPQEWKIKTQERVVVGNSSELVFQIDIVLYNKIPGKTPCGLRHKIQKKGQK